MFANKKTPANNLKITLSFALSYWCGRRCGPKRADPTNAVTSVDHVQYVQRFLRKRHLLDKRLRARGSLDWMRSANLFS